MDKVCVNINEIALTKALILWNTGVDNEDGGTCNITAELPWTPEWEKYMTWTEASAKFIDGAIGNRDESIYPIEYLNGYLTSMIDNDVVAANSRGESLRKITSWAKNRAKVIICAYERAIAELNKRIEASKVVYGIIEKSVGVDSRGFVKYEKVILIKDNKETNIVDRLWAISKGLVPSHKWEYCKFGLALTDNNNLFIGENYYCHLGNKVTNS